VARVGGAECLNRWLADSTNEPHLLNETFWDASDVQPSIVRETFSTAPHQLETILWGHRLPRTGPLESPRRVVTFLRARRGCKRRLGTAVTVFAFLAVYAALCADLRADAPFSTSRISNRGVGVRTISGAGKQSGIRWTSRRGQAMHCARPCAPESHGRNLDQLEPYRRTGPCRRRDRGERRC